MNSKVLKSNTILQSNFGAMTQQLLLDIDYSTFKLTICSEDIIFILP